MYSLIANLLETAAIQSNSRGCFDMDNNALDRLAEDVFDKSKENAEQTTHVCRCGKVATEECPYCDLYTCDECFIPPLHKCQSPLWGD